MHLPTEIGYRETYTIRTYEIDNRKIATVPALLKLMHEAAMQNVIKIKLSVWDLEPHKVSWVLMRKSLKINRLPILGETIHIVTYPVNFEKFFTYRDYKVFDENGALIAASSSTWLLMDTESRKMTRILPFILEFQKKMPNPEVCLPAPMTKLPKFERVDFSKPFRVDWHDLDFNNHLSNVFYIQMMLEGLEDDILSNGNLEAMNIVYKTEGRWKDEIVSEVQKLDNHHFLHRLVRKADGKELALSESIWKP